MANYNIDIKTDREKAADKRSANNRFQSQLALEAPKVEGGHNDILDGFVRGRPVKKTKKISIPQIPKNYDGKHRFDKECSVASVITMDQDISRSVADMSSKWKVAPPEYLKGSHSLNLIF